MSFSRNELSKDSAASKPEEKIKFSSSGTNSPPAWPEHPASRSARKRNSTTAELATPGGHAWHEENTARRNRKRGPTTTESVAATETEDQRFFFDANQWIILGRAHQMVEELVKNDEGPYRKKLLDLAQFSIENLKDTSPEKLTPGVVVAAAWESVCYYWADPSNDTSLTEDGACAYTSMGMGTGTGNDDEPYFPVIGISSSFRENDYPAGQEDNRPSALTTMDDNKTLLLFFKKIKREFLHVIYQFLAIKFKKKFGKVGIPEKYTPHNSWRRRPALEVGDHDEEEDSGGPILPLIFNQKLSTTNPLCLYFNHGYLQLSDEHVQGLLKLDLYSVQVPDGPYKAMKFSIYQCRA